MNCGTVFFEPSSNTMDKLTPSHLDVSPILLTETLDIFLGLSWVFEKHAQAVTKSTKTEKRRVFFAPLDVSLGIASADPIQDPRVTTHLFCTHILRFIGNHHTDQKSPLFEHQAVLSAELQALVTDRGFDDHHILIQALLTQFSDFYVPIRSNWAKDYWKIKGDLYAFRASQAYNKRKEWMIQLARLVFQKHVLLEDRNFKSGMGLVSVYV